MASATSGESSAIDVATAGPPCEPFARRPGCGEGRCAQRADHHVVRPEADAHGGADVAQADRGRGAGRRKAAWSEGPGVREVPDLGGGVAGGYAPRPAVAPRASRCARRVGCQEPRGRGRRHVAGAQQLSHGITALRSRDSPKDWSATSSCVPDVRTRARSTRRRPWRFMSAMATEVRRPEQSRRGCHPGPRLSAAQARRDFGASVGSLASRNHCANAHTASTIPRFAQRVPCNSGTVAVALRTSGALLLSRVQASAAEFQASDPRSGRAPTAPERSRLMIPALGRPRSLRAVDRRARTSSAAGARWNAVESAASRRGCRLSRAGRSASERRREMSRSRLLEDRRDKSVAGKRTSYAAVDICDSLRRNQKRVADASCGRPANGASSSPRPARRRPDTGTPYGSRCLANG
jgi:hypothetical protein